MSFFDSEEDRIAREKQYEKQKKDRLKEVRKNVKIALLNGSTVPYSFDTLCEANIGTNTIRKVCRELHVKKEMI